MATINKILMQCISLELGLDLQLPSYARLPLQMDPQVSESDSFSYEYVFAADLLTFILRQHGIYWRWPSYPTGKIQHHFRPKVGQIILNFMLLNTAGLKNSTHNLLPENGYWNPENLKYLINLSLLHRPGREFALFVAVNSVLCHIGKSLARGGHLRLLDDVVGIIAFVVRVLVGNGNWRWLENQAEGMNKVLKIPGGA